MDAVSCTRLTTAEVSASAHGAAGRTWPVFQSRSMLFNNSTRPAVSYQAQSSTASKLASELYTTMPAISGALHQRVYLSKKNSRTIQTPTQRITLIIYLSRTFFNFISTTYFNFLEERKIFEHFHTFSLKVIFSIMFSVNEEEEKHNNIFNYWMLPSGKAVKDPYFFFPSWKKRMNLWLWHPGEMKV